MKTTYQSKGNSSNAEVVADTSEQTVTNSALVETYLSLKKESDKVNSKAIKDVTVDAEKTIEGAYEQALKSPKEQKVKKGSPVPVILCVLLVLGIVGFFGYRYIQDCNKEKLVAEYEAYISMINGYYADLEGGTAVDTSAFREGLAGYETQGIDIQDVLVELDTIDQYCVDLGKLGSLEASSVNLMSSDYTDVLDEIENSVDSKYSVADLRVSMKALIKEARAKRDNFVELESAMLNDTDFSMDKYQSSVDALSYDLQKSELMAIPAVRAAERVLAEAEARLAEVNVPVENEGVADKKLSKKQRVARDEAIAARDLAVSEAEVVVSEAEQNVYDAYCSLYGIMDEIYGSSRVADFVAEWESSHPVEVISEEVTE